MKLHLILCALCNQKTEQSGSESRNVDVFDLKRIYWVRTQIDSIDIH